MINPLPRMAQYVVLYQGSIFSGDRVAWINNR